MSNNDWTKNNEPVKVFGTDFDGVIKEWERFMDLEGYSDQTKKLKSAGFMKFARWQLGVEKPSKAKAASAESGEGKKKASRPRKKATGEKKPRSRKKAAPTEAEGESQESSESTS